MRIHGYCHGCHRVKLVNVSAAGLARAQLAGNATVLIGICDACTEPKRR